jgi:hypothetical protein
MVKHQTQGVLYNYIYCIVCIIIDKCNERLENSFVQQIKYKYSSIVYIFVFFPTLACHYLLSGSEQRRAAHLLSRT